MKKNSNKWKYAVLNFKVDFLILNPEVLPKENQKQYKNSTKKFLDGFAEIMKIHTDNPDISSKAFSEVFGDKTKLL
jgi:hypothetical protein